MTKVLRSKTTGERFFYVEIADGHVMSGPITQDQFNDWADWVDAGAAGHYDFDGEVVDALPDGLVETDRG